MNFRPLSWIVVGVVAVCLTPVVVAFGAQAMRWLFQAAIMFVLVPLMLLSVFGFFLRPVLGPDIARHMGNLVGGVVRLVLQLFGLAARALGSHRSRP